MTKARLAWFLLATALTLALVASLTLGQYSIAAQPQPTVKGPGQSPTTQDFAQVVSTSPNSITLSPTFISAGSGQYLLTITSNTQLTVPAGARCAEITLEGASVRRTSDGTGPSTTQGTLIVAGSQWGDCGPLASYKFSAVSGAPTLTIEYFK